MRQILHDDLLWILLCCAAPHPISSRRFIAALNLHACAIIQCHTSGVTKFREAHMFNAVAYASGNPNAPDKGVFCLERDTCTHQGSARTRDKMSRVQRPLLWQALQRLGVHGSMLRALQSLYENSHLCVKVQGRTGQSVASQTGLKQGCPLSPTLFGLFADGLHRFLAARCPDTGPVLSDGRRVPDLGYADDFVLLAESPEGLQALINATVEFCDATGLLISADKTKVLVFSQVWPGPFQWVCYGQPPEWVVQMKYLGLFFQAQQGMHATYSDLNKKVWGAWALLQRQFGQLQCAASIGLLLKVYKTCVPPTGLYGSEVGGPLPPQCTPVICSGIVRAFTSAVVRILKQIVGVRYTVATAILMNELGVQPLRLSPGSVLSAFGMS